MKILRGLFLFPYQVEDRFHGNDKNFFPNWLIGGLENWGINYFFDKDDNLCYH
jgi:hypothetical protein